MKHVLLLLMMTVAYLAADEEPDPTVPETEASREEEGDPYFQVASDPAGNAYFPKGRESYYTKYYRAAELPSFQSMRVNEGEVRFRMAFLRSFTKPLFLSYSRDESGAVISVARLSGRLVGDEPPGSVELEGNVRINPDGADSLEKLATWPVVRDPFKALDDRLLSLYPGLDGERWILEVVNSDGYTMVDIWSPRSFEYYEPKIRNWFEKKIRKNPHEYSLPESFKDYELPDLDVSVFVTFGEDLLMMAEMTIPEATGGERARHGGE